MVKRIVITKNVRNHAAKVQNKKVQKQRKRFFIFSFAKENTKHYKPILYNK